LKPKGLLLVGVYDLTTYHLPTGSYHKKELG
jgi:hypothetical protein